MSRIDRRFAKSEASLREALIDSLQSKRVEEITVEDICSSANLNRSTFYLHYNSVTSLFRSLQDYWCFLLRSSLSRSECGKTEDFLDNLLDLIQVDRRLSLAILRNMDIELIEKFEEVLSEAAEAVGKPSKSGAAAAAFLTGGVILTGIAYWARQKFKIRKSTMLSLIKPYLEQQSGSC